MKSDDPRPRIKLNLIDVFAGIGGFTLGFRGAPAGSRCEVVPRLLVDSDQSARNAWLRNAPDVRYFVADVHTLSGKDIRQKAGMRPDETVHILLGGPPCQGFSFLGKRALDDPRNIHVVDFLRLMKELRPLVGVIENVPLMITSHDGAVVSEVCGGLSALGYASCADLLQANEFGVPQIRRRAFVIAYRADLGMAPHLPNRTHERITSASELSAAVTGRKRFEADKRPYISVEDAIGDLPALVAGHGEEVSNYNEPPQTAYQTWARSHSIALFNHRSRSHGSTFLKKVSVIEEGGANKDLPKELRFSDNYFSQAYARLCRYGLANTITTSFANPGSGRFLHYRDLRSITVREAARLQSFPDTFVFDGELTSQMRHVGNAVPPLLAAALRNQIVADLAEHLEGTEGKRKSERSQELETAQREQRSAIMRAVPSKNTAPERVLRKALSNAGVRGYRTHSSKVPGNPDIVFNRVKLAVFVDGCFWHGCPRCYRAPTTNKEYWKMKVARNRDRDAIVTAKCKASGWTVIRLWEHDVNTRAPRVARQIARTLERLELRALARRKRLKS